MGARPQGGAQIPHFGRRRRPMKPHISAPKAPKFWKKQCFWPQKRHFRAKKGKNWPFFEKLSIFRKFSNFVRKFSKNFGLDETPQAKKVAQKCNKNENFGGWWNPTEGQPPPNTSDIEIWLISSKITFFENWNCLIFFGTFKEIMFFFAKRACFDQ